MQKILIRTAVLIAGLALSLFAAAATALPAYLSRPAGLAMAEPYYEEFAEVEMPLPQRADAHRVRGRHWQVDTHLPGVALETPAATVWSHVRRLFADPGWKLMHQEQTSVTMRYSSGGKEAWARINYADPSDMRLTVVELAAQQRTLSLVEPSGAPEKFGPQDDIPFLAPLPGSKLVSGGFVDAPLRAALGPRDEETVLAQGVHDRLYAGPPENVTPLQVSEIYGAALRRAGWTLVHSWSGGFLAHYTRKGRDLWAVIGSGSGDLHFRVADAGATDLVGKLRKDCRAPLDGVLFEFNQATLRADSTPALERAKSAVIGVAGANFEIQGHTDNVGGDDYNLKLSQARARSVLAWLTAQGVSAARLGSAGYGKTQPIASNETAEGRARNRRVELVCRK